MTFNYQAPAFCIYCGHAFPWTEARIQAAKELAQELTLSDEDKKVVSQAVDDLVKDTPTTIVSATKFKRLVTKAGSSALSVFRDLLVSVISETARKIIWPV